jgi:hypothetical protein
MDADEDENAADQESLSDRLVVQPGRQRDGHDRDENEQVRVPRRFPPAEHDEVRAKTPTDPRTTRYSIASHVSASSGTASARLRRGP